MSGAWRFKRLPLRRSTAAAKLPLSSLSSAADGRQPRKNAPAARHCQAVFSGASALCILGIIAENSLDWRSKPAHDRGAALRRIALFL